MSITEWLRRYSWTANLNEVKPDDAETLVMGKLSKELVDELQGFGVLLVNEAISRTAQLDSKATNVLGWTSTALAFLLIGSQSFQPASIATGALIGAAVLLAITATIQAGLALFIREWSMPSEADWFRGDLFADPMKLRIYHVLGLLETHQNHNRQNIVKGDYVRRSQLFLTGTTIIIGMLVILRLS